MGSFCVNVALSNSSGGRPCPLSIGIMGKLEQLTLWKGICCLLSLQPAGIDARVGVVPGQLV